MSPKSQYEYCLTDPDVRKHAEAEGKSVEQFCHELIYKDGL